MLAAAGMECEVHAPASFELTPETEALLAWTVREGATNVIRHSGARAVTITISASDDEVTAEVADDGAGPAWEPGRHSGRLSAGGRGPGDIESGVPGSGLAGLAERARAAGAKISAGEGRRGKGIPAAGPGARRPVQRVVIGRTEIRSR